MPEYTDELQRYMTHQPEQPNRARPYLDAARNFYEGGLHQVLKGAGMKMPAWSDALAGFLNNPAANAALGVMSPMKGDPLASLRNSAMEASQAYTKANLPPPKNLLDRAWDNYTKHMSESEMLQSEPVWGTAKRIAEQDKVPIGRGFAKVVNDWYKRSGVDKFMTENAANEHMGTEQAKALLRNLGITK